MKIVVPKKEMGAACRKLAGKNTQMVLSRTREKKIKREREASHDWRYNQVENGWSLGVKRIEPMISPISTLAESSVP